MNHHYQCTPSCMAGEIPWRSSGAPGSPGERQPSRGPESRLGLGQPFYIQYFIVVVQPASGATWAIHQDLQSVSAMSRGSHLVTCSWAILIVEPADGGARWVTAPSTSIQGDYTVVTLSFFGSSSSRLSCHCYRCILFTNPSWAGCPPAA